VSLVIDASRRVVFPGFLFPVVILGYIYYRLALGYLNTGRDLRRMEANSRSPIYSDFRELLEGIVTVRAFSAENRFLDNLHFRSSNVWFLFHSFFGA
jgi:ABC-type multidrug transport system fused ATPase/permease subunit